jgi:energy-converting hydrogenase B subunit D
VTALQAVALVLVALAGTAVALVPDPRRQAVVSGVFGLLLALVFFLFQAPDVAIAQLAVVGVGLPVMLLLALVRLDEEEEHEE